MMVMVVMLVWEAMTMLATVPLPHRLPSSRRLGVTYGAPRRGTRALWMVCCWRWHQASWRWYPTQAPPLGMHKQRLQGTLLARPTPAPLPYHQPGNSLPLPLPHSCVVRCCTALLQTLPRLHGEAAQGLSRAPATTKQVVQAAVDAFGAGHGFDVAAGGTEPGLPTLRVALTVLRHVVQLHPAAVGACREGAW